MDLEHIRYSEGIRVERRFDFKDETSLRNYSQEVGSEESLYRKERVVCRLS